MSAHLPWWKKHVDAWRSGTRGMSLELRGFYSECLDAQWDLQRQLPLDVKILSVMLCCNPRSVRKLMPQLLAAGKMVCTATGYYNPRMMRDILGVEVLPVGAEFEPNSARIHAEFEPKVPKNPINSTRVFKRKEIDTEIESPKAPKGAFDEMPSHVKPIKSWSQAFTSPDEHPKVTRSETGAIQLVNGNRQRWLDEFGGDTRRLDLALIEITGEINPGSRTDLVADVERRLARKVAAKLDQDQRYQSAVTANAASKSTTGPFGRPKIDLAKLTKSA